MIKLKNISKSYGNHQIFDNFNLMIKEGEMLAIMGRSGAGKSTLLNIIGLVDLEYDGNLIIDEESNCKNRKTINKLRRNCIGYLFQNFGLLENETIYDNLKLPFTFSSIQDNELRNMMDFSLSQVNIDKDLDTMVYNLSGGEMQRIAIAKLLMKEPKIILADEPTGSLDEQTENHIMEILCDLNCCGVTVVIVTHSRNVSKYCTGTIIIGDNNEIFSNDK